MKSVENGCGRLCSPAAMESCLLLDRCKEGVFCLDRNGVVLYANPTACEVFEQPSAALAGTNIDGLIYSGCTNGEVEAGSRLGLSLMLSNGGDLANAKAYVSTPGSKGRPIEYRIASVLADDGAAGFVMTFRDVSAQLETEERLAHLAHHDPLTDLPNRRLLSERLEYEILRARRQGEWFALHLIDLDDFKRVNDRYGHPVGDNLLINMAGRMRASVRLSDTVARVGGDEFAIIQVGVGDRENAAILARKLLEECSKPVHLNGYELFPAVTIGVSLFAGEQSEESLWAEADAALYQAKARGKNTFVVVDEEITRSIQFDIGLVAALEHAIDYQQFRLLYQPLFSIESGALVGVEALLRWDHPEFGSVGPARFIPIAEEHGLIHAIGHWVMVEVCQQIRLWIDAGIPFGRVAVNISALQLSSTAHVQALIDVIEAAQIPWATLELEVTETAYFSATRDVLKMLEMMQHNGAHISIDDFGTGYSSLLALRRMKANSLKIDRAFIVDLNDPEAAGIVRETVGLAHTLGMVAIAEGVEDMSQLQTLKQFGCDSCQGFYLGEPVAASVLAGRFFSVLDAQVALPPVITEAPEMEDEEIRWRDVFKTGITQIDQQHEKIVQMINRIGREVNLPEGPLRPSVGRALDDLLTYIDYHFRCEEAFMARHLVASHHAEAHRDDHTSALETLRDWIASCRDGLYGLGELRRDMAQWLSRHILAEDRTLGEQIVAISRGVSPEEAYRAAMISAALECR